MCIFDILVKVRNILLESVKSVYSFSSAGEEKENEVFIAPVVSIDIHLDSLDES